MEIKIGDRVRVKNGIKDPDFDRFIIGGYKGTVYKVNEYPDETMVGIKWDEKTLSKMPRKMLIKCEKKALEHDKMFLSADDVEVVKSGS